jgi:Flp pilus assembly pilin Flp
MLKNESGATTVEYALLLFMIAALLLASVVSAGMTFGSNAEAIGGVLK